MSESASFLYFVIFFAIAMSSTGWHIMIKGRGLPQNLWLFFIMMSNVFVFSSVAAVYFPFSKVYFFVAMLCFVIFSTLYIYSFPHAVLPNLIWTATILLSVVFMVFLFIYMKTKPYLVYFVLSRFKDDGLSVWVPDVLCHHSDVVLWNLFSVQMFF